MIPMLLGLFVEELQPKVGLEGYDILFTYFVVEAKSKRQNKQIKVGRQKLPNTEKQAKTGKNRQKKQDKNRLK